MPPSLIDTFYNKVSGTIIRGAKSSYKKVKSSKTIDPVFERTVTSSVEQWIGPSYKLIPEQKRAAIKKIMFWYVFLVTLLSADETSDQVKNLVTTRQTRLLKQADWYVKFQELLTSRERLRGHFDDHMVRVEWHEKWCGKYETEEAVRSSPSLVDIARILVYRAVHVPVRRTLLKLIMTRSQVIKQTRVFPIPIGKDLYSIESALEQAVRATFRRYDSSVQDHFASEFFALLKRSFEPSEPYLQQVCRLLLQRGIVGLMTNDLLKFHRNIRAQYIESKTAATDLKRDRPAQTELYRAQVLAFVMREAKIDLSQNKADLNRKIEFSQNANRLLNEKDMETQILTTRTFLNFKPPIKGSCRVGYDKGCGGSWASLPESTTKLWFERPLDVIRDCSFYNLSGSPSVNTIDRRTIPPLYATVDVVGLCSPANVDVKAMYRECESERQWIDSCRDTFRRCQRQKHSFYFWFDPEYVTSVKNSASDKSSASTGTKSAATLTRKPDVLNTLRRFLRRYMDVGVRQIRQFIGKGDDPVVSVHEFARFQRCFARVRMPLYCTDTTYHNIWRAVVNRLNQPRPRTTIPVMFPGATKLLPARTHSRTHMNLHYLNCQHFISWQYMRQHYRSSDDPLIKDRRRYVLFEFIRRFVRVDDQDQRYICRSCGTVLKLDRYLHDYQKDRQGRIIMLAKPRIVNLKENSKYNRLSRVIDSLASSLEILSERIGLGFKYEGTRFQQNQKRQSVVQDTIDAIRWTQAMESVLHRSTSSNRVADNDPQYPGSIYSTVQLPQIENDIIGDISRRRMNIVLCYLMVQVLLNLTPNDIQAMANHVEHRYDSEGKKNVRNVTYFEQWADKLFRSYVIFENANTPEQIPVMKHRVLAYLLFRFGFAVVGISIKPTTTTKGRMERRSMWYPAPVDNLQVQQALRSCIATMVECLNASCTMLRRIGNSASIQNSIHYDEIMYVFERIQSSFYRSLAGDNQWFGDDSLLDMFKAREIETTDVLDQYPELKPVVIRSAKDVSGPSAIKQRYHVVQNRTTFWKDPRAHFSPYVLYRSDGEKRAREETMLEHNPSCRLRSSDAIWNKMLSRVEQLDTIINKFGLEIKAAVKQYEPEIISRIVKDGVIIRFNENGNPRRAQGTNRSMYYWYDRANLVEVVNKTLLAEIRNKMAGTFDIENMRVVRISQPGNLTFFFNQMTHVFIGHRNTSHVRNRFVVFTGRNRFKLEYVPRLLDQLKNLGSDATVQLNVATRRMNLGICINHMINSFYYLIQSRGQSKCRLKNQLLHSDMFQTLDRLIKLYDIRIEESAINNNVMLFKNLMLAMCDRQTTDMDEYNAILLEFLCETMALFDGKHRSILYYTFFIILQKLNDDKKEPDTVGYNDFKYMLHHYQIVMSDQVSFDDFQEKQDDAPGNESDTEPADDMKDAATQTADEDGYGMDDTDNDQDDITYDADD